MTATDHILTRGRARRRVRAEPELARLIRARAGLTQTEMATLIGVDRSAISRWEAGRRTPRAEALTRYAELLDRLSLERA